jgi:hypothetical protein
MRNYKRPLYTEKHFNDLANEIQTSTLPNKEKNIVMNFLNHIFILDNENYDPEKFRKACFDQK